MSLVNLSHVCSHLQNASLARLGLTSIPYTKLHLSLSLLLHKQGFLSQVKLGGPSPPASCFPPGVRDNGIVSAHPHSDRSPLSNHSALTEMVMNGKRRDDLLRAGFGSEAIEFAEQTRLLSKEQLEKDGWDTKAIDFVMQHQHKSREQMEADGLSAEAIAIVEKYAPTELYQNLAARTIAERGESVQDGGLRAEEITLIEQAIRRTLRRNGFDLPTLQHLAGESRYATEHHLNRDGITISAMGLDVTNQPFTPVQASYRDPDGLDTEGVVTQANRASRRLWLGLKYFDGMPVLRKAKMLSKPTKRIWLNSSEIGRVVRGARAGEILGLTSVGEIMAVSTDRGILEARECDERKVGGMVLCRIS
ncbi:Hypothetical protein R9X50_00045400 [Acrodontium crateriforme]|uniref:Ribosomal protein S8 n=1 Tax=Acrodontium crateriforme TaxID=150365 RepID=A0AAQ3R741_9PEZI|nr:Hypothetical protein R9X50_00045400 [Acrodontium crateriforme]